MRKFFCAMGTALLCIASNGQNGFSIKGTIKKVTRCNEVIVDGSGGSFRGKIMDDGSFTITGNTKEPSIYLIHTDSSGANVIWLENQEYKLVCKEIPGPNFRIDQLEGPTDAKLYYAYSEPRFYIRGIGKEDYAKKYASFYTQIIDSIFTVAPKTVVLPEILRVTIGGISDEKMQYYMDKLDSNQRNDSAFSHINYYFKRKEKISSERLFEDFTMKDSLGNTFQLSQLKKKLILIDFWSSDCMPCRRKHTRLVEMYSKYAAKGLEIVSVSLDDDATQWKKAIIKDKMTWINVCDFKGWKTPLAEHYYVKAIPDAFWIDGNRTILGEYLSTAEIEKILEL